jgi:single-stranded-DNA-specific exonuclease
MRTIILTHGDCDGVCSGALALAANPGARVFFSSPTSILTDLEEAKGFQRLIASDLAINISTSRLFKEMMDGLSKKMEVIYLDHHPLPDGFTAPWLIHDLDSCGSLLTFQYFQKELDNDMNRVAMYGAIGDYRDSGPLAVELTTQWDKRTLYYQAGTVSQGVELERRDHDFKRDILEKLSRNVLPSEISELAWRAKESSRREDDMRKRVEHDVVRLKNLSYVIDPNGSISKAAIYARVYGKTPVGMSAEHRAEKHVYDISVRAIGDSNLNILLDRVATKYGGSGGGHSQAGGGRIPENSLKAFLNDMDRSLGS